ncbi:MAG: hypothetical protein Q9167_006201 [Letrouitia subvulpina]
MAAVAAVAVVFSVIEASKERDNLRDAIRKLAFARVDCQQNLDRLQVMINWTSLFDEWFSNEWHELSPDIFEKKFGTSFQEDMNNVTRSKVIEKLRDLDNRRGSWTNEDPDVSQAPSDHPSMRMMSSAKPLDSTGKSEIKAGITENGAKGRFEIDDHGTVEVKEFLLENVKSATECVVIDVSNDYSLRWRDRCVPSLSFLRALPSLNAVQYQKF